MVNIVPFEENLLKEFVYDGIETRLTGYQISSMAKFYNKLGDTYIGLIDGKVVGIGGAYPLWDGLGSLWLFLNKNARNYKKSVFKALLQYMNELIKKYDFKSLIVECIDDSFEAQRLIQHLGFKKIKEMKMSSYSKIIRS